MEKKIGRYENAKELSAGGQGNVYLAHDPILDVDVIIKELKAPDDERAREKFEKEVKILREMHSTNIVRTYDFFTEGDSEYIGMEYVDGMDLSRFIANQKDAEKQTGLPLPLAMHIFRQVCQGLHDAHRKGIIHRDIKPENILISKEGDVLLGDFGIAGTEESFSSEANGTYGSRRFMAPELFGGETASYKSDIYSMGAMLYNMLFGMPPFEADDPFDLECKIVQGNYIAPVELDPNIRPSVNRLIIGMLEYEGDDRPDIEEVIASVEEYERSLTGGIRAVLQDALKASIASGKKKLDYHNLKLENYSEPVDLCSPASLYTKSCSVLLSFDVGNIVGDDFHKRISPHLYALFFKDEGMGFRFQKVIELSNSLRHTEYQSGMQYFKPGEYLVRIDFGSHIYLKRFSLQSGQKEKLLPVICESRFCKGTSLRIRTFDKENGKDITGLAIFEKKKKNGRWIQMEADEFKYSFDTSYRLKASCRGYESNEFYPPPEIGCYPGIIEMEIPLSQKIGENDIDSGDKAFDITDGVLKEYRGSATAVTIPDGVTEIAGGAFRGCTSLVFVKIPKSVTEIDDYAFQNCNIRELSHPCLTIQDGLAIKDGRLLYCASQEADITVPAGITEICGKAFAGCTSLSSVNIPDGVEEIGELAFDGCTSLSSVSIPGSVTKIGDKVFWNCTSLTSVCIPGIVKIIGNGVFADCTSLSSVSIPNGVEEIGEGAFGGCESLSSVSIPGSVTKILGGAFFGCISLSSISIPGSVTEIGKVVFAKCTSLCSVIIPGSMKIIGDKAFSDCTSLATVTILDGVTKIAGGAFDGCTSLSSVSIPCSVTEIGDNAFMNCISLTSVSIPRGVNMIGEAVFSGCTSLSSVFIPEGVKKIQEEIFKGCTSLNSIIIPCSVTEIGDNAFRDCTSLASVCISEGVTEIGWQAFWGCTSLTSVTIPDGVTKIASSAFVCCKSLSSVIIPKGVTRVESQTFSDCTSLSSVTIPEDVTEIGEGAFGGCESLTAVTIPESVKEIGEWAFAGCTSLVSVTIPGSVKRISELTFSGCTSLASVIIPDSVTEIGKRAFEDCTSLMEIRYAGTKEQWAAVEKDDDWDYNVPAKSVICTDGEVKL